MSERMSGGNTTKSDQDNHGATAKTLEETMRPPQRTRYYRGNRPVGRQDDTVLRVRCPTLRTVAVIESLKRKHPGLTYTHALDRMAAAAIDQYPELARLRGGFGS